MPRLIKLTDEEIEDSKAMDAMLKKAEASSKSLNQEIHENLTNLKQRKKINKIIKQLFKDEKITEEKRDKYYEDSDNNKFEKIIKSLKKHFPEYLDMEIEEEKEEKPKTKRVLKKSTKKKGEGIKTNVIDYFLKA